ncbi:MAG: DUF4230 domain-containing protein [Thermoflexales bacterium]|nr:DUF4230 domain-containing protein [Thermoflexales bacterium]MCS7325509.1 DUF4230 domain-containing protein [Thermoflexales bacterium]MCX7938855.1 DUF4230 domain-containing protein [Thermoflexales bacterium]MDW8053913.1 DUF4230 domain-containing protein [Anaerolineae bacterium]MDW8292455.1 DUF4230 domain-containing protein [Anaerolineae bacterium]
MQSRRPALSPVLIGCSVAAALMALGVLGAALVVGAALRETAQRVSQANPLRVLPTLLPASTPTIVPRGFAVLQLRTLGELATAQKTVATVVEAEKARVGNILYERLLLVACGRVKAGVRLEELTEADLMVSADGNTVRVRLPQPVILDAYLIDDASQRCTTRVYDRTNLLILPETKELESQAREKAVEAIRQVAVDSGLLDEAYRSAQIAVERVLLRVGFKRVEFVED